VLHRWVRLQPENAIARYNLACCLTVCNKDMAALGTLRQALDLGYRDLALMTSDPDLERLHSHPTFVQLALELQPEN